MTRARRRARLPRRRPRARPDRRRRGVLRVRRRPGFPDAIEEAAKNGRRVLALRTFSKIYGLAGLRIGYGVGPADRDRGDPQGAARVRRDDARAGGRAREPRRAGRARAAPGGEPGGDGGARGGRCATGASSRSRPAVGQLPLRRRRDRCRRAQRRAPPARGDRPADGRRSARRRRSGSPRARPTRSRSSPGARDVAQRSSRTPNLSAEAVG